MIIRIDLEGDDSSKSNRSNTISAMPNNADRAKVSRCTSFCTIRACGFCYTELPLQCFVPVGGSNPTETPYTLALAYT
jgi:hypothetical protein